MQRMDPKPRRVRRMQRIVARTAMIAGAVILAMSSRSVLAEVPRLQALPARLADTGLYSDFATRQVDPRNLPYEPQYPLWTDGAAKRRWIQLPPGSSIDASDPNAWRFPVGTKLWKEFSFGRPVETRYLAQVAPGEWIYATYAWNEDGTDAVLAPERGIPGACEIRPGVRHDIPGRYDCRACHEGQPTRVLGFNELQLSPERDPLAPHAQRPAAGAVDLRLLSQRGLIRGLQAQVLKNPPRIEANSATARAALGYLFANCAHCHNEAGPLANLNLSLAVSLAAGHGTPEALATTVERPSRYRPAGVPDSIPLLRLAPGDPGHSLLLQRMSTRLASVQMPPLGTHLVDAEAMALLETWVRDDLGPPSATRVSHTQPISEEKP